MSIHSHQRFQLSGRRNLGGKPVEFPSAIAICFTALASLSLRKANKTHNLSETNSQKQKKTLNINSLQNTNNSSLFGKKHLPLLATTSQPIEKREHHTLPISPTCPPLGRVGKSNGRHKKVGCFKQIEKYSSNWKSSPNRGEN